MITRNTWARFGLLVGGYYEGGFRSVAACVAVFWRSVVQSVWGSDLAIRATCLNDITAVLMEVPTPLCFVSAWRKGVASAQRSGLTSEESRGTETPAFAQCVRSTPRLPCRLVFVWRFPSGFPRYYPHIYVETVPAGASNITSL